MTEKYWDSEEVTSYEEFNIAMPSEKIAYDIFFDILNPSNKNILDFGCFEGNSSQKILKKGANKVIGVDSNKKSIETAEKLYEHISELNFIHIPKEDLITTEKNFDACAMTFVHPTIESEEELQFSFEKISKALSNKGELFILGLNPIQIKNPGEYIDREIKSSNLTDGKTFQNTLILPNNHKLLLNDIYWSKKTLYNTLNKAGFSNITSQNITQNRIKEYFQEKSKSETQQWKDEWKSELYQIIIAKK